MPIVPRLLLFLRLLPVPLEPTPPTRELAARYFFSPPRLPLPTRMLAFHLEPQNANRILS